MIIVTIMQHIHPINNIAWKGYVIAKNKDELSRMKYYAIVIQTLERELGIKVSSFPELNLLALQFVQDNPEYMDKELAGEEIFRMLMEAGVIKKGPISKVLSGCIVLNDILLLLLLLLLLSESSGNLLVSCSQHSAVQNIFNFDDSLSTLFNNKGSSLMWSSCE
jgi:hypothetical protein